MMRHPGGEPLTPGGQIPRGMCQPPADAFALADRLDAGELRLVLDVMIIWSPEAFEKGLRRVSERRVIADNYRRERRGLDTDGGDR